MLRFLLACLFVAFAAGQAHAQPICGTPSPTAEQARLHEETFREFVLRAKQGQRGRTQATNVAVKVWIIRPFSNRYYPIQNDLKTVFDVLNTHLGLMNINVYQSEAPTIIQDERLYYLYTDGDGIVGQLWNQYHVDNAVNLYFIGSFCDRKSNTCPNYLIEKELYTSGMAAAKFMYPNSNEMSKNYDNWVVISTDELRDAQERNPNVYPNYLFEKLRDKIFRTIPHEFGHYFNLYHTFRENRQIERVDGSNCINAGDYVCDTPADPFYIEPKGFDWKITSCKYESNSREFETNLSYSPMFWNMMSYYPVWSYNNQTTCARLPLFTAGQYERMNGGFAWRNVLNPNPRLRYYLDGQKHLAVEKLMSASDTAPVSQFCAGATARVSAFWYGRVDRIQYNLQVVNDATGGVAAEFNDLFLNQYQEKNTFTGKDEYLTGGSIRFTLPASLPAGRYRLRVRNLYEGVSDTSQPFDVLTPPTTPRLTGTTTIQERQSATLTLTLGGGLPASYAISPGLSGTAASSPHTIQVQPTHSTTYRLTSLSNGCGAGAVPSDSVRITVIPITGTEPPLSAGVRVFPNPAADVLTVELPDGTTAHLELTDLLGRVRVKQDATARAEVSLGGLGAGVYVLKVSGKTDMSFRIVKP